MLCMTRSSWTILVVPSELSRSLITAKSRLKIIWYDRALV